MENMKILALVASLGLWQVWSEAKDGGMTCVEVTAVNALQAIEKSISKSADRDRQITAIREVKEAVPVYEIYANGYAYEGESDAEKGIKWGDKPYRIEGVRNMRSHLEKILDRHPDEPEITIKRVAATVIK